MNPLDIAARKEIERLHAENAALRAIVASLRRDIAALRDIARQGTARC